MKKIWDKKEFLLIGVVILLFVFMSFLSLTSINQLRGNARVVNYAGIVRGATQRLVKKELQGYPDDALITRLDGIVNELISGEGPNNLIVLHDTAYLDLMHQVENSWRELKGEIEVVRAGGDKTRLFELSEDYFTLVDQTVSAAEQFSEHQVSRSTQLMIGVNAVFIVLIIGSAIMFMRSSALKKRAEALGKIAYVDALTQMPNRASCEREIAKYTETPPEGDMAVFMFDMNNLKRVNDELGHQGGDRVIADFARIIKTEGADYGFVGRYGGDEFVAFFPDADETTAQNYLTRVNEKVVSYNLLHVNAVEKLSFAVGYQIAAPGKMPVNQMIDEADRCMYVRKRQMKENKEA